MPASHSPAETAAQPLDAAPDALDLLPRKACPIVGDLDDDVVALLLGGEGDPALGRLAESQKVTVRVSPADMEALKQHRSEWLQATRGGSAVAPS